MQRLRPQSGFSIIDVLVTCAIIAFVTAGVLARITQERERSRDLTRVGHIKQYAVAIQLYYGDHHEYPPCDDWQNFSCLQNVLVSGGYMRNPPQDPRYDPANPSGTGYHYDRWCQVPNGSNSQQYRIWAATSFPQAGTDLGWWSAYFTGSTNCIDPA